MSMPSVLSTAKRRVPQQERGERRVAELLDAAASVIAETGYEAATMTAIAERAGASIGAVYQYFPNKEAIVRALRAQHGDEMEKRWTLLDAEAEELSVVQIADRIFDVMVRFMEEHPAYFPLLSAPLSYRRDPAARNRLRERFAQLFRRKSPSLSPEQAFRVANVTLQVVKSMSPLYAEAKPKERQELIREFKLVVATYLNARLSAEGGNRTIVHSEPGTK
jgi:AcrR family transcriptional regulator